MPRRLRSATSRDIRYLEEATLALRAAAGLLARAECKRLAHAARALAKRADGARRHADRARNANTLTPGEINARCQHEAWCLIWSDNRRRWEIQRDDEARTFADDDQARDFVAGKAAAGSALHRTAVKFTLL